MPMANTGSVLLSPNHSKGYAMFQLQSVTVGAAFAALHLVLALGSALGADEAGEVKLLQTWRGEVKLELRKQAPDSGFIADAESWEKLWKAYRVAEKVPEVDFQEHLILVGVNSDPNQIGAVAKLSEKGDLSVVYLGTLIGFEDPQTCAYQFAKISRKGIKSIKGKPLKIE
jgi:hypothetical protein